MFNAELKERAKKDLEEVYEDYKRTLANTVNHSESLYEKKVYAVEILKNFSSYIQKLSNKPIEFETILGKIEMNIKKFDNKIEEVAKEVNQAKVVPTAVAGAGALAAGGGGIVGGEALLALAGPIGWAIGGSALLGAGLILNGKNKEAADKIEEQILEIKKK